MLEGLRQPAIASIRSCRMTNSRSNVSGVGILIAGLLLSACPAVGQSSSDQAIDQSRSPEPDFSASEPPVADQPENAAQPAPDQTAQPQDDAVRQDPPSPTR